jgi:hypothetical protein
MKILYKCLLAAAFVVLVGVSSVSAQFECCSTHTCGGERVCIQCGGCGCFLACNPEVCICVYECLACADGAPQDIQTAQVTGNFQDVPVSEAVAFLARGRGLKLSVVGDPTALVSLTFEKASLGWVLGEIERLSGVSLEVERGPGNLLSAAGRGCGAV